MKTVLSESDMARTIRRMAHEILERNSEPFLLLGIPTRGVSIANLIHQNLESISPGFSQLGQLDIGLYRDDLDKRPAKAIAATFIPGSVDDKQIVLVDDVLFSGRTIRAALDALSSFGRPAGVQLAVLIDRGHRQLPIRADFVGKNIPTSLTEKVSVKIKDVDGENTVVID